MFRVSYRKGGQEFHVLANHSGIMIAAGKLLQFFISNPHALHREADDWFPKQGERLNLKLRSDHVSISPENVDRSHETSPSDYINFSIEPVDYYEIF